MASPEQGESAAGSPHSTPVPEEMDFDLFGPSSGSPSAQPPTTAAQVPGSGSAPTGAPVQLPVPPTPTLGADQLQQLMLQMLNNQNTALQQQQNQMNFLMQAQSAQLTLLNRRLDEEEARRKAEEARRTVSADPFAAASAGSGSGATVPAPTGSPVAPPSVPASVVTSGGSSSFGGRAEKYLPPLPLINHGEMKQGRIRELEEFHRFLEVLSSWLALTDDAFVGELRQCLFVPNEIQQVSLPSDTAGRSARLFYLLQQALAKWDRGLEILRSVSTRQGNAAAGYEGVRELYRQYSVNSRMEAVYIRDEMLKLHTKTGSLKRPLEVVRFLEDEISKGDKKLVRFPDLCLNAADRSAILLQAVSVQAREYLVLHGKTGSWNEMAESLRFYEEQLRMVELPGGGLRGLKGEKGKGDAKGKKGSKNSGSGADKSKVACWYCGKTGHYQEECRQRLADEKKKGKGHGEHKGKDKGKGQGAKNNKNDKSETKGKGERGKGKGKNKKQQARAVAEGEAEEEPEGETVMALQASGELVPVGARGGVLRTTPGPTPEVSALAAHQVRLVGIESQDSFWLVDSGATSHCMSASCFEKYEVLRTYDFKPTLSNASNDMIEVLKVCDVRVRFGKQVVVLEHCLITNLDFNVLSPYVAYVKGWHTLLTGSPHIYNKKSKKRIRLTVKDRAWYAVASLKDDSEKMEVDALKPQATTAKPPKAPETHLKQEAPRANKAKKAQKAQDRRSLESVKSLEYTPFKFLLRSLRTHGGSAVPVCEGVASEQSDRVHLDRLGSERWSKDASEAHGVDDESGPWLAWCLLALCVLLALVSECVQRSLGAFVRECVCKASGLGLFGRLRGGLRRLQGSASASVCVRKVSGVGLLCRLRGGLLRLQGSECESVLQGWSRSQKTPKPRKPDAARVALFLVGLTCVHIAKGEQVEVRCVTNVGTDFPTGTAFVDGKPPEEAEYSLVFRGACAPRGLHEGLPGGGDGQCGGESSKEARGSFYEKAAFDSPEQAAEGNSGIRGFSECGRFLRGGSTRGSTRGATEEPTEKPTEEPTEEPTEKPTEELTEEPTEKPTEELAEEPTEKPTKELAKKDGESDEDAWGRWRGPLEDASSSWHGTTAPMEPPEGPSVDALGRQKERDAAQWTGPTTALGRSSIWYDPEAEEKTVVPEGGAKKKKKKKKESAPAKGEEEVPETPPPSEEQLQVQRIQELFQTFGPEETGDLPVEGEMESSSPTVDVLAVPTEPEPATMGPTVPLEPVPETEDAGGEAKKKKRKRRKKKASQACAGDVVMVEEDPAEGAGGVGDIDLGAGDAGGVETIDVESAGPVDQKKRKKKKGARSWYHRLTPKRTPLWYHRLVCRSGQKKRRKKKKGVRKTAPVEEPSEEEGEQVPEMVPQVPEMVPRRWCRRCRRWCLGYRRWCRGCRRWCRWCRRCRRWCLGLLTGMVPQVPPLLFRLLHLWRWRLRLRPLRWWLLRL